MSTTRAARRTGTDAVGEAPDRSPSAGGPNVVPNAKPDARAQNKRGKGALSRPFSVAHVKVRPVRHRPSGESYWRWTVYQDGEEHGKVLGWMTQREAEVRAAAMLASGEFDVARQPQVTVTIPVDVRGLMETWCFAEFSRPDLCEKTKQTTKHYAQKIVAVLGDGKLRGLGTPDLEDYRDRRLRAGAAPNCVNHEIAILRRAWQWGRDRRYCPERELRRPRVRIAPTRPKTVPTSDDLDRLLGAMAPDHWSFVATLLLAQTGMRIGEVADLRWRHVDFTARIISVPHTGKTGTRPVAVSEGLIQLLRTRRGNAPDDRHVLGVGAGTVRTSMSQRYLPDACERAGIPAVLPHGLRRYAVNRLYDRGIDPTVAGAVVGHAPVTAARYYRQVSPQRVVDAAKQAGLLSVGESLLKG